MPHVAFATCQRLPAIYTDDRLAAAILEAQGVTVSAAVWDDPNVAWSRFDQVVIRSTWDYHHKPDEFVSWIKSFRPGQLWNPPQAVLDNLNKKYLTEFAARGVRIVPTRFVAAGEQPSLLALLEQAGWHEAVVKPAISAGARETWRTSLATAASEQSLFANQVKTQDTLIQAYLPEIASQGEWSLLFFNGVYSHAVLKVPATGDFRVQEHLGGSCQAAQPTASLIAQAQSILAQVDSPLLYARVDGVEQDGQFVLMELEITEPLLFLQRDAAAAQRFAAALMSLL